MDCYKWYSGVESRTLSLQMFGTVSFIDRQWRPAVLRLRIIGLHSAIHSIYVLQKRLHTWKPCIIHATQRAHSLPVRRRHAHGFMEKVAPFSIWRGSNFSHRPAAPRRTTDRYLPADRRRRSKKLSGEIYIGGARLSIAF